jgi:hypothetical protein
MARVRFLIHGAWCLPARRIVISLAFEAAFESQSGMAQERSVYARERAARTYGPGAGGTAEPRSHALGQLVAERTAQARSASYSCPAHNLRVQSPV